MAGARLAFAAALATALAALSPSPSSAQTETSPPELSQTFRVVAEQKLRVEGIREDGLLNSANRLRLPNASASFEAQAEWRILGGSFLDIGLEPRVDWSQIEGSFSAGSWSEKEGSKGKALLSLPRAELRLGLRELGLWASVGKVAQGYGSSYFEPLSLIAARERGSEPPWTVGLQWLAQGLTLDARCGLAADPAATLAFSATLGAQELGLIYDRAGTGGSDLGAWWRGQLGLDLIAYAELMMCEDASFIDLAAMPARDLAWRPDCLGGLGWTPPGMGVSFYLEYRYRGSGYAQGDWDAIGAATAGLPGTAAAGSILAGLPWFQTSRDTVGIYAMGEPGSAGSLEWSIAACWMGPGGLYASASGSLELAQDLFLVAKAESAVDFGSGEARSEIDLWPWTWSLGLGASWRLDAKE